MEFAQKEKKMHDYFTWAKGGWWAKGSPYGSTLFSSDRTREWWRKSQPEVEIYTGFFEAVKEGTDIQTKDILADLGGWRQTRTGWGQLGPQPEEVKNLLSKLEAEKNVKRRKVKSHIHFSPTLQVSSIGGGKRKCNTMIRTEWYQIKLFCILNCQSFDLFPSTKHSNCWIEIVVTI
jgi:hypothetical protein